jgi:hypothetical protein
MNSGIRKVGVGWEERREVKFMVSQFESDAVPHDLIFLFPCDLLGRKQGEVAVYLIVSQPSFQYTKTMLKCGPQSPRRILGNSLAKLHHLLFSINLIAPAAESKSCY